jgi:hypothetical protein
MFVRHAIEKTHGCLRFWFDICRGNGPCLEWDIDWTVMQWNQGRTWDIPHLLRQDLQVVL